MVTLEINSESMFISILFKKTQTYTNHCVSTDLSVFCLCSFCSSYPQSGFINPQSGFTDFCKFGFTCLLHDLTSYTEKH